MTTKASESLTNLSEAQRTQALERFAFLRPALEGRISQTQLAREQHIPLSTMQRYHQDTPKNRNEGETPLKYW